MLLYTQGRFFSGAVSFALPDNCYLVIAEAMNYYENGLEITTADEEFSVAISTQYDETDTRLYLDDMLTDTGFKRLSETKSIQAGDLFGYYAMYQDRRNKYCEYHFPIEEVNALNALVIIIMTSQHGDIEAISGSKMVKELLDSFKIVT